MPNAIAGVHASTMAMVSAAESTGSGFTPMICGSSPGVSCNRNSSRISTAYKT